MGKAHGVDIVVTKQPDESLLIEAKGEGSLEPMRVNFSLLFWVNCFKKWTLQTNNML
jgi:hypothetical protein